MWGERQLGASACAIACVGGKVVCYNRLLTVINKLIGYRLIHWSES